MESLKFYIKEHKPFILLYGLCLLLGVILFVCDIYKISIGDTDRTTVKSLLTSISLPPAIILYGFYCRKFFRVYKDYKTQHKETKILYLKHQSYSICVDNFNGAYKFFFCSEKPEGKKACYWLYRKDLMYDELTNCLKYKVTYYKKTKCLYSIEPICDYTESTNRQKRTHKIDKNNADNKTLSATLTSIWFPFLRNSLAKHSNPRTDTQETIVETVTAIGIPVKRRLKISVNQDFLLRVQNEDGKKKALLFNSTEILGLGDLNQRPGYMGYGNFIGTKYEIEYYKHSHTVKTMKIIN